MRLLWLAPNINHYKARLLDDLARDPSITLTVVAGEVVAGLGHRQDEASHHFTTLGVPVIKRHFGWHPHVFRAVAQAIKSERPDVILFPLEKKLLPLLIWVKWLRLFYRFKLFSYNHPLIPFRNSRDGAFTRQATKVLFRLYDGIIFYTESARDWAVSERLIPAQKAYFANNTLDTGQIRDYHDPSLINESRPLRLLFIGRLIATKRIDLLLDYYRALKMRRADIRLTIIGDGPLADQVKSFAESDPNVDWVGALTNEADIAPKMAEAHAVFMPGETGLSVVHAFAYGKPYVTLDLPSLNHGPEITYLEDGENGLLLSGDIASDAETILERLEDEKTYQNMCKAAADKARNLSIENWKSQVIAAIGAKV